MSLLFIKFGTVSPLIHSKFWRNLASVFDFWRSLFIFCHPYTKFQFFHGKLKLGLILWQNEIRDFFSKNLLFFYNFKSKFCVFAVRWRSFWFSFHNSLIKFTFFRNPLRKFTFFLPSWGKIVFFPWIIDNFFTRFFDEIRFIFAIFWELAICEWLIKLFFGDHLSKFTKFIMSWKKIAKFLIQ